MSASTNALYHYTGLDNHDHNGFNTLKKILSSMGLWFLYSLENVCVGRTMGFYIPVTCFCDIPFDVVSTHQNMYGNHAIGFSRTWAKKVGINPVWYIQDDHIIEQIDDVIRSIVPNVFNDSKVMNQIRVLTAYNKYIPSICPKSGVLRNDFYAEREWRYTPSVELLSKITLEQDLFEDDEFLIPGLRMEFHKKKDIENRFNSVLKRYPLRFTFDDIEDVVVDSQEDKAELVELYPELEDKIKVLV